MGDSADTGYTGLKLFGVLAPVVHVPVEYLHHGLFCRLVDWVLVVVVNLHSFTASRRHRRKDSFAYECYLRMASHPMSRSICFWFWGSARNNWRITMPLWIEGFRARCKLVQRT